MAEETTEATPENEVIDDNGDALFGDADMSDAPTEGADTAGDDVSAGGDDRGDAHSTPDDAAGDDAPAGSQPAIDDTLLSIAEGAGISRAEAERYPSAIELANAIDYRRSQQRQQSQPAQPQQQAVQQAGGQQQQQEPISPYEFNLDEFKDLYDPDDPLLKHFQAANEHYSKQQQWLYQQVQSAAAYIHQMNQQQQAHARQQVIGELDRVFDELDDPLYGQSTELTPDARIRREDAYRQMDVLARSFLDSGMQIPPFERLRDLVLGVSSPGRQQNGSGNRHSDRNPKNGRFTTARANRSRKPLSGKGDGEEGSIDAAVEYVRQFHS